MTAPAIHRLTQVSSTLDLTHEFAARGAPEGTVIVAAEQLQGRGTRGRSWHSPPGGLWFSILYRTVAESGLEILPLRIGLAIVRAVELVAPELRLGLKWPNDVMLEEKKLGGILCEARWQGTALSWIAVGVGLNVANPIPSDVATSAVALASRIPGVTAESLVIPIATALRQLPLHVTSFSEDELAQLSGRDWMQGRRIVEPVPGVARGILPDGSLLVERPDGSTVAIKAGRVLLD